MRNEPPREEANKTVEVELEAFESVVDYGTQRQTWLVYVNENWTSVRDHPRCELESLSPGPATIWHSRATLSVPPGTWLQLIRRKPDPKRRSQDPLSYLRAEARRAPNVVERNYFRAGKRGQLERARGADAPA